MELIVNNEPYVLNGSKNDERFLSDLITALNLPAQAMAVAINRQVIAKQNWANHVLKTADCVDVVRAIGGG